MPHAAESCTILKHILVTSLIMRLNQEAKIMDVAPSRALKSATRRQTRGAGLATKTNVGPWKRGEGCRLCAGSHRIVLCPVFKSLSPEQRRCVVAVGSAEKMLHMP